MMSPVRRARPLRSTAILLALAALALVPSACSAQSSDSGDGLDVLTSFYPLEFVAKEIGGDLAAVTNLTPSGGEPHDLELAPVTVRKIDSADVVIYLSGFQPAVDSAVDPSSEHVLNVEPFARLAPFSANDDDGHAGHDHGPLDPHFWLDPVRLADVAEQVGAKFAEVDPEHAADYQERTESLVARLTDLDEAFASGLQSCESTAVVTSHAAFTYLSDKYGLEQISIAGLDPEGEPSPARLREISAQIKADGIETVFYESSSSAKVAEVLAHDLGITSAVLNPLETLADPDSDYLTIMNQNLTTLRTALACH